MLTSPALQLSGERLQARYALAAPESEAQALATTICYEQTVEFPAHLVPAGDIRDEIVGRIESVEPQEGERCVVEISYAMETAGQELTQLLNLLFGNSSLKPGIRLIGLTLPEAILRHYPGPSFGVEGLRQLVDVWDRPLLCTGLKPMGLSISQLAELAYTFAAGGIDLVKDDHGLANQPFSPFESRVEQVAAAIAQANRDTGRRCLYVPNVTAAADAIEERLRFAKQAGAGGVMLAPGLVGLDTVRRVASDDSLGLPIISHPALQGSFVVGRDNGISHGVLFGTLARLAGVDASIFPNHGGRFAFGVDDCQALAEACAAPLGQLRPIFPVPAGGMRLERVPQMRTFYGADVIFLIGGDLHGRGVDLAEACREFHHLLA